MHELSVTQSILNVVLEHAQQAGAKRVTRIDLRIGEMTGIVDESVQFFFDFLARDTLAAGASLSFTRVPVRFRCRACGAEFEPEDRDWHCPGCAALSGEIVAGKELAVESIEVE